MFTRGATRIVVNEKPIPYVGPWEKLYTFCSSKDAERIAKGKEDPGAVSEAFRYADAPGVRLVPLHYGIRNDDPKMYFDRNNELDNGIGVYRDGYIWCGIDFRNTASGKIELLPAGAQWGATRSALIHQTHLETISLKYANFVYVVDDAAYRDDISREDAFYERAKTMVPISDYDGKYASPFVIVCRDIMFDEIVSVEKIESE